jgi:hypothetical protein
VAVALLALLTLGSPSAEASHWCGDTLVRLEPTFVPSGSGALFTITFRNQGANDTQILTVEVQFEWEASPRILGSGALPAGGSLDYSVMSSPVPAGFHVVTIEFNGTNTGDPPLQVTTCSVTRPFATTDTGQDFLGGILNLILMVLTVVIISVVVMVVLAYMVSRKRRAPPTPPQTPPPEGPMQEGAPEPSTGPPPNP